MNIQIRINVQISGKDKADWGRLRKPQLASQSVGMSQKEQRSSQRQGGISFFIIAFPEKIRYFEKENQGNSMSSDQRTRVMPVVSNQGLAP